MNNRSSNNYGSIKDAYKFNSKNKMISKAIYVVKKAIAYKKRKKSF